MITPITHITPDLARTIVSVMYLVEDVAEEARLNLGGAVALADLEEPEAEYVRQYTIRKARELADALAPFGDGLEESIPGVTQHLRDCPPCLEMYASEVRGQEPLDRMIEGMLVEKKVVSPSPQGMERKSYDVLNLLT